MKSGKNRIVLRLIAIGIGSFLTLISLLLIVVRLASPSEVGHGIKFYEFLCLDGIFMYVGIPLIILGSVRIRHKMTRTEQSEWDSKLAAMKEIRAKTASGVKSPEDQAGNQPGIGG